MALWTAEREYETLPLDDYKASRGAYLGAVIDDAWQGSPLPSLMRWAERQQMDHGPLGALVRSTAIGMALPGLAREGLEALGAPADAFKPQGKVLTAQEVLDRSKPLGLNLRRGMSEAAFEGIATERRRQLANEAVFERARAGTGTQILGVLAEFATGAVDPLNLASAFLPVSRLGPVARALERVGSRDARLFARGAIEGAAGAVAVEPLVALAATDENPAYGFSSGLLNVAFGSALGGGLHWLGGRIVGAENAVTAPRPPDVSAADILRGSPPLGPRGPGFTMRDLTAAEEAAYWADAGRVPDGPALWRTKDHDLPVEVLADRQRGPDGNIYRQIRDAEGNSTYVPETELFARRDATPQATARAIEKMSPEARQTLLDTVVRQAANDLTPDVDALARATGQFIAPPARYPAQPANLGRRWSVDIAALRAEAREFETLRADAARIYGGDAGARLKAPPDFVPTPAQLKAAKDYVTPPRGKAEPETLAQFVRRQGGVAADDPLAGDLRSQDLGKSGLLRKTKYQGISTTRTAGMPFDDMALRAYEAGYFPERPTAEQFAAALAGDASGSSKVYSTKADQADLAEFATAREARAAFEDWMGRGHAFGDPRDLDPRDLAWWLANDPTERRLAELDDALARGVISEREALERASLLDAARAADEQEAARCVLEGIVAYHGSPHRFERFDLGKIGTGEGFLARGYGLYFAENRVVADDYRATLSGEGGGHLYEVKINAAPDKFIDLDEPISKQSPAVRAAIERFVASDPTLRPPISTHEAGDWLDVIDNHFQDAPAVSSALNKHGIAGVRYLDQGSREALRRRATDNVTRNIVVFDDRLVEIVARDGKPVEPPTRPEGFERGLDEPLSPDDYAPLTREEFHAVERELGRAEAAGERLPEGDGGPVDAGVGAPERAPGARGEPGAAADPGAVSGRVTAGPQGNEQALAGYDLSGWVQRQADWRADAHVDVAASARAEQLTAALAPLTPEKALAEQEAAASKLLTDADKAELKLAEEPFNEAKALADAYAQCKIGGGRGE